MRAINRGVYGTQGLLSNFNADKICQEKWSLPLSLLQREILLTPISWKQGAAAVPPRR